MCGFSCPREAKVEQMTIDSTEYRFKMALAQQYGIATQLASPHWLYLALAQGAIGAPGHSITESKGKMCAFLFADFLLHLVLSQNSVANP